MTITTDTTSTMTAGCKQEAACAINVAGLKKLYKGGRGVTDVSLSIAPGDVYGLLGANGAGKTTTLKAITQLVRRDSGTIEICGMNIDDHPAQTLAKIGALIETPAFYGYMSAAANMRAAARYQTCAGGSMLTREEIAAKLAMVGLGDTRALKARFFSLGMKQRLGLALAMTNDPPIYILDEPSNGLDIDGIIGVRNIILELAKSKRAAFLVSSHLSAEVEKMCNKVGVIHGGRLAETAIVADVLARFESLEEYYLSVIHGAD